MPFVTEESEISFNPDIARGPILLCAATRWEAAPLAKRFALQAASDSRYEGILGGRRVTLLRSGVGPASASAALNSVGDAPYACAVSTGFAGALQPKIASGDLLLDLQGSDLDLVQAAREIAALQKAPIHFGKILHSDRVLARPEDKIELARRQRGAAVDMETAAVRSWAADRNIPALAIRAILDKREDRLPSSLPAGEDFLSLLSFAAKNAAQAPLLLKLAARQKKAMSVLAGFLEQFLPRI